MSMLRYPHISGSVPEQLRQTRQYLWLLAEELNVLLSGGSGGNPVTGSGTTLAQTEENRTALRDLILRSAEVVESVSQRVSRILDGKYVAVSDFGAYTAQTALKIELSDTELKQLFSRLEEITSAVEGLEGYRQDTDAYLRTGMLDTDEAGMPVYGIEVGQKTSLNGQEVFRKFARFTSEKLSFYDQNGMEVAFISDRQLYITAVEITRRLVQGKLSEEAQPDGSVVTRWVG